MHNKFKKNGRAEARLLPFPALEHKLTQRSVLNLGGSPALDVGDHENTAGWFFQYKLQS